MLFRLRRRFILGLCLTGFFVHQAEAASIRVSEASDTGGGTLINDGSGDVSSSNGSSSGSTSLLADLGVTDLSLATDLAQLHFLVSFTDLQHDDAAHASVSAELNVLRVYGTVENACPALNCAFLDDVNVGGSLSFNPAGNTQNVLFAFDIVGALSGMPWGATPAGLSSPQVAPINAVLDFQLTSAQIAFIMARLGAGGFAVGDVTIGLGAFSEGVTATGGFDNVGTRVDLNPIPEPTTAVLLGMGAIALARRRAARRQ